MPKKKTKEKAESEEKKTKKSLSEKEFASAVIELAEKGLTAEKIGEALRQEGIHSKEHGKISRVLRAKNIYENPDIKNTTAKLARITAQMEKNRQDKRAMRERERIFSLLRKLKAYHKVSQ